MTERDRKRREILTELIIGNIGYDQALLALKELDRVERDNIRDVIRKNGFATGITSGKIADAIIKFLEGK